MRRLLNKTLMSIVTLYRRARRTIATAILRGRTAQCGKDVGAARIPTLQEQRVSRLVIMPVLMALL